MTYNHQDIEKKWQEKWDSSAIFHAQEDNQKPKFYCLIEFPYPSGDGLHVGHTRSYTAFDIVSRKRRHQGYNVLYPIGWDAFGLPTENYAIKTHRKPHDITHENTDTFRRLIKSLGLSFDWSREINTTDPAYYKWTQWMFLEFFKAGLAYKTKMAINWCTSCKIGLANEEVVRGVCERCGGRVEKRDKEQWMIAITKYAERLLQDLDTVHYLEKIKVQQRNWIGKSEGAEIEFFLDGTQESLKVFTTRPDTIFGVTYIVVAPEHPLVEKLVKDSQRFVVDAYVRQVAQKTEIERGNEEKEKTGVFTGSYAINPANGEKIPVWIADYVLMGYGTGVIMAVPQHDERDRAFAIQYGLSILDKPLISFDEALERTKGKKTVAYKLRDWVFSRQRYWGEPIPLVHCETCSSETGGWVAVPENQLPVVLPDVEKYEPTDTGESPLATIDAWVNTTCPICGSPAKRETDTMPNWAGSSWYFLRYIDPHNSKSFASFEKLKHWMPVDLYNGGMEHATLHLLYSRFWNKFLFDRGHVPVSEPYQRRHSHGLVLASDGTKMSKSKGNFINPDEIVREYGADSLRMYILFMGPFEEPVPWSLNGLIGVRRFLDKVYGYVQKWNQTDEHLEEYDDLVESFLYKISQDIDVFKFNTAVAAFMSLFKELTADIVDRKDAGIFIQRSVSRETLKKILVVLCPFASHLSNECWEMLGEDGLVEEQSWPELKKPILESVEIAVQINGKARATITLALDVDEQTARTTAFAQENIQKHLAGKELVKVVYVPGRILNIVAK